MINLISRAMAGLKNWLLKYWRLIILSIVAIIFFLGAASFNYFTQSGGFVKWLSPDETANYAFAKLYAQEGRITVFEKYNLLASDIIHPRSFRSDYGWLKPVSFLGIILIYGKIGALTSYKILPYLTPFFAALSIIFYYLLIKEIFGKRNALISALILAVFPALIYYSARSMFHNVLFMALVIYSLYFTVAAVRVKKDAVKIMPYLSAAAGGAFLGLAIITRTSELIWIAPAWLILWLFNIRKFRLAKLLIFMAFLLFSLVPAMYWNKILYQSYWQGGYGEMNRSIINIAGAGSEIIKSGAFKSEAVKNSLLEIKNNFFHFGWQPAKSLKMLYYYFAVIFYWIFWPTVLGFLILAVKIKKWRRRHYAYFAAYFTAALILVFYYGSWDFHDNPDPKSYTIGNSYVRYWLPIYLGAIPLASLFLIKLSNILRKKFLIYGFRALIIILVGVLSIKFVLAGSDEGLIKTAENQAAARPELARLIDLTEPQSVIITRYHDKLLFPERKVIVGLFNDDNMNNEYAVLAKKLPLYYYNFTFPEKDINYLNNSRLAAFGLKIKEVEKITKNFTLYRLSLRATEESEAISRIRN